MPKAIERQIQEWSKQSRSDLALAFQVEFQKLPAPRASRELILLALSYRLQEQTHGDLSKETKRLLRKRSQAQGQSRVPRYQPAPGCAPGTQLVRIWNGERHHVTALESGFEYQGQRYTSLSQVARHITGSNWSGPAFFGIRKRPNKKVS